MKKKYFTLERLAEFAGEIKAYVNGVKDNLQTQLDGKALSDHNHDSRYYTDAEMDSKLKSLKPENISDGYTTKSFYINTHPENNPAVLPFINNDIAFLLKRGGSVVVKYDGMVQNVNISNVFDGSPSYWAINPSNVTEITIELTLHKVFTWTNTIYVDMGANGWRAKNVRLEVINTTYANDTWTVLNESTNRTVSQYKHTFTYTPVGATNAGGGFNKIRLTFSSWATATIFRIAAIGIINYGSAGLRETFVPKDGGEMYGGITPYANNSYNIGSDSKKYANMYAVNFKGNADSATKATKDSANQQIDATYIKDLSVSGRSITYTKGNDATETITIEDGGANSGGGANLSYEAENEQLTLISGSGELSDWKLLTTKTGTSGQITLPTVFHELHIVIGNANYMYTFHILADYLTSTATLFRNGYSLSGSGYGDVYVSVTKTSITAWTSRKEGVIQEVTVKVYYK